MKKLILTTFLVLAVSPFFAIAQSDTISTSNDQIIITPITHGSLVLEYDGKTIYVDPYNGIEGYKNVKSPDLVLITDIHGDHLDKKTLKEIDLKKATFIVPDSVKVQLKDMNLMSVETLANGQLTEWQNIKIEAIPMYNLPETDDSRHPKGRGNGYVITFDDTRLYIAGDTEGIPEMRALENIDIAFIPMNMPYTMDIEQAANAVLEFAPKVVYPYHFRGSDVASFKKNVESKNKNIDVRLREWY